MKRWWNIAFQIAATAGQLAQVYQPFIPEKYAGPVQGGVAMLQATVAIVAHNFNPDGTPSAVAYVANPDKPFKPTNEEK